MTPKLAIVYYSTWGHVKALVDAEAEGIKEAGGTVDIFQIPETLSQDVLSKMGAPGQDPSVAILNDPQTLEQYDGFLLGIPTRYGTWPAQWKTFWDSTGGQWQSGTFWGKHAGIFVSTAVPGGGQEATALNAISVLAHHGIIYVPLGYKTAFGLLSNMDEVHGGSPWGAGTFSKLDGSRQPSALELDIAKAQGKAFFRAVAGSSR